MLALLGAPENLAFVSALLLMLMIGAVQAIGIGADFGVHAHADLDVHADMAGTGPNLLGWLGIGVLPLLMLLVVFLGVFGVGGLLAQQALHDATGQYVSAWIAAPTAGLLALPLTGLVARGLARIIPRDETTAVPIDDLVGEPGRIVNGRATQGSPARARVEDRFGQAHYVMVEPNSPTESFEEGETVLIVRRDANLFRAISRGDHYLPSSGL